jgi:hypothetical protein
VNAEIEAEVGRLNGLIDGYNAIVPADRVRLLPVRPAALRASGS